VDCESFKILRWQANSACILRLGGEERTRLKYQVTEPASWKRVLEIEVPAEQIQTELDAAYRKYRKEVRLPGFRRGKVPLDVLKANFGDHIKAEVLEEMVPNLYDEAREEAGIDPVSQPVIEDLEFEEGDDLRFKAVVEIKPAIDLDDYKGINVSKKAAAIGEEEIGKVLESLRDRHADVARIDGAAEKGHYIMADLQSLDEGGVPIVGEKKENQFVEVGSGAMGEAFDEQLLGIKAGDVRRVSSSYSEDHEDESLAGQPIHMEISVRDVLQKKLPDLDDDFAKDVGSEDLDTLKESIKTDLEQEPEREVRSQIIQHLVESNEFEIPDSMLKTQMERMIADAKRGAREEVDEEELKKIYEPMAVNQIKRFLILEEIAEREDLDIQQDQVDERIESIASGANVPVDQVRRMFRENGRIEQIESEIREEKVIAFLVEHADIKVE
jgi:trigger factor